MKNAIKVLTGEKVFSTLNKYKLHSETVYLKAVDFAGNVLFDNSLSIDLFKIDKFVKEMHKLSEVYNIDVVIRYKGFATDDEVVTFKHSL